VARLVSGLAAAKPMNISAPFIRRPVATTLLSLAIALSGLLGFANLPVAPLPQTDLPTIAVVASFPVQARTRWRPALRVLLNVISGKSPPLPK
jgi:hypothetical protein